MRQYLSLFEIPTHKCNSLIAGISAVVGLIGGVYLLTTNSYVSKIVDRKAKKQLKEEISCNVCCAEIDTEKPKSKIVDRKAKKQLKEEISCNVCCAEIDTEKPKSFVTCSACEKTICREAKCSNRLPDSAKWECQACHSSKESLAQTSSWVAEQLSFNQHKFVYPMRARSEIYIPINDQNDSSMHFESVSQVGGSASTTALGGVAAATISNEQKLKIREYVEEVVAQMLGGSLDSVAVGQISKSESYLPALVNGHQPNNGAIVARSNDFADLSQTRLRQLIETIIAETLRLPLALSSSGAVSEVAFDTHSNSGGNALTLRNGDVRRHRTEHYFEPKIYQDLLATAVLNKIADTHGNAGHLSESSPKFIANDVNQNFHENQSISSSSSIEPRSDCSFTDTDQIINLSKGDDFSPCGSNSNLKADVISKLQFDAGRESALSDYIAAHMVPLPDLSTPATESEEDDYLSVTSSQMAERNWEDNWLFKKKKPTLNTTVSAGNIGMLVPAPKEDVRAQIGDKIADEISDLSEMGSDSDDSSLDLLRGQLDPLNNRLLNKHLIGGQNTKMVLDELIDRSSMISSTSPTENEPIYTETKNKHVISPTTNTEAINTTVTSSLLQSSPPNSVATESGDSTSKSVILPPPCKFDDTTNGEVTLEADAAIPITDPVNVIEDIQAADGCMGFSIDVEEFDPDENVTARVPSVIEILAAIALGPMLAVPASEQQTVLTPTEMSSLKELSDLALLEIKSRDPGSTHKILGVIDEESLEDDVNKNEQDIEIVSEEFSNELTTNMTSAITVYETEAVIENATIHTESVSIICPDETTQKQIKVASSLLRSEECLQTSLEEIVSANSPIEAPSEELIIEIYPSLEPTDTIRHILTPVDSRIIPPTIMESEEEETLAELGVLETSAEIDVQTDTSANLNITDEKSMFNPLRAQETLCQESQPAIDLQVSVPEVQDTEATKSEEKPVQSEENYYSKSQQTTSELQVFVTDVKKTEDIKLEEILASQPIEDPAPMELKQLAADTIVTFSTNGKTTEEPRTEEEVSQPSAEQIDQSEEKSPAKNEVKSEIPVEVNTSLELTADQSESVSPHVVEHKTEQSEAAPPITTKQIEQLVEEPPIFNELTAKLPVEVTPPLELTIDQSETVSPPVAELKIEQSETSPPTSDKQLDQSVEEPQTFNEPKSELSVEVTSPIELPADQSETVLPPVVVLEKKQSETSPPTSDEKFDQSVEPLPTINELTSELHVEVTPRIEAIADQSETVSSPVAESKTEQLEASLPSPTEQIDQSVEEPPKIIELKSELSLEVISPLELTRDQSVTVSPPVAELKIEQSQTSPPTSDEQIDQSVEEPPTINALISELSVEVIAPIELSADQSETVSPSVAELKIEQSETSPPTSAEQTDQPVVEPPTIYELKSELSVEVIAPIELTADQSETVSPPVTEPEIEQNDAKPLLPTEQNDKSKEEPPGTNELESELPVKETNPVELTTNKSEMVSPLVDELEIEQSEALLPSSAEHIDQSVEENSTKNDLKSKLLVEVTPPVELTQDQSEIVSPPVAEHRIEQSETSPQTSNEHIDQSVEEPKKIKELKSELTVEMTPLIELAPHQSEIVPPLVAKLQIEQSETFPTTSVEQITQSVEEPPTIIELKSELHVKVSPPNELTEDQSVTEPPLKAELKIEQSETSPTISIEQIDQSVKEPSTIIELMSELPVEVIAPIELTIDQPETVPPPVAEPKTEQAEVALTSSTGQVEHSVEKPPTLNEIKPELPVDVSPQLEFTTDQSDPIPLLVSELKIEKSMPSAPTSAEQIDQSVEEPPTINELKSELPVEVTTPIELVADQSEKVSHPVSETKTEQTEASPPPSAEQVDKSLEEPPAINELKSELPVEVTLPIEVTIDQSETVSPPVAEPKTEQAEVVTTSSTEQVEHSVEQHPTLNEIKLELPVDMIPSLKVTTNQSEPVPTLVTELQIEQSMPSAPTSAEQIDQTVDEPPIISALQSELPVEVTPPIEPTDQSMTEPPLVAELKIEQSETSPTTSVAQIDPPVEEPPTIIELKSELHVEVSPPNKLTTDQSVAEPALAAELKIEQSETSPTISVEQIDQSVEESPALNKLKSELPVEVTLPLKLTIDQSEKVSPPAAEPKTEPAETSPIPPTKQVEQPVEEPPTLNEIKQELPQEVTLPLELMADQSETVPPLISELKIKQSNTSPPTSAEQIDQSVEEPPTINALKSELPVEVTPPIVPIAGQSETVSLPVAEPTTEQAEAAPTPSIEQVDQSGEEPPAINELKSELSVEVTSPIEPTADQSVTESPSVIELQLEQSETSSTTSVQQIVQSVEGPLAINELKSELHVEVSPPNELTTDQSETVLPPVAEPKTEQAEIAPTPSFGKAEHLVEEPPTLNEIKPELPVEMTPPLELTVDQSETVPPLVSGLKLEQSNTSPPTSVEHIDQSGEEPSTINALKSELSVEVTLPIELISDQSEAVSLPVAETKTEQTDAASAPPTEPVDQSVEQPPIIIELKSELPVEVTPSFEPTTYQSEKVLTEQSEVAPPPLTEQIDQSVEEPSTINELKSELPVEVTTPIEIVADQSEKVSHPVSETKTEQTEASPPPSAEQVDQSLEEPPAINELKSELPVEVTLPLELTIDQSETVSPPVAEPKTELAEAAPTLSTEQVEQSVEETPTLNEIKPELPEEVTPPLELTTDQSETVSPVVSDIKIEQSNSSPPTSAEQINQSVDEPPIINALKSELPVEVTLPIVLIADQPETVSLPGAEPTTEQAEAASTPSIEQVDQSVEQPSTINALKSELPMEVTPPIKPTTNQSEKVSPPVAETKTEQPEASAPPTEQVVQSVEELPTIIELKSELHVEVTTPIELTADQSVTESPLVAELKIEQLETSPTISVEQIDQSVEESSAINELKSELPVEVTPPIELTADQSGKVSPPVAETKTEQPEASSPPTEQVVQSVEGLPTIIELKSELHVEVTTPIELTADQSETVLPPVAESKTEQSEASPPPPSEQVDQSVEEPPAINELKTELTVEITPPIEPTIDQSETALTEQSEVSPSSPIEQIDQSVEEPSTSNEIMSELPVEANTPLKLTADQSETVSTPVAEFEVEQSETLSPLSADQIDQSVEEHSTINEPKSELQVEVTPPIEPTADQSETVPTPAGEPKIEQSEESSASPTERSDQSEEKLPVINELKLVLTVEEVPPVEHTAEKSDTVLPAVAELKTEEYEAVPPTSVEQIDQSTEVHTIPQPESGNSGNRVLEAEVSVEKEAVKIKITAPDVKQLDQPEKEPIVKAQVETETEQLSTEPSVVIDQLGHKDPCKSENLMRHNTEPAEVTALEAINAQTAHLCIEQIDKLEVEQAVNAELPQPDTVLSPIVEIKDQATLETSVASKLESTQCEEVSSPVLDQKSSPVPDAVPKETAQTEVNGNSTEKVEKALTEPALTLTEAVDPVTVPETVQQTSQPLEVQEETLYEQTDKDIFTPTITSEQEPKQPESLPCPPLEQVGVSLQEADQLVVEQKDALEATVIAQEKATLSLVVEQKDQPVVRECTITSEQELKQPETCPAVKQGGQIEEGPQIIGNLEENVLKSTDVSDTELSMTSKLSTPVIEQSEAANIDVIQDPYTIHVAVSSTVVEQAELKQSEITPSAALDQVDQTQIGQLIRDPLATECQSKQAIESSALTEPDTDQPEPIQPAVVHEVESIFSETADQETMQIEANQPAVVESLNDVSTESEAINIASVVTESPNPESQLSSTSTIEILDQPVMKSLEITEPESSLKPVILPAIEQLDNSVSKPTEAEQKAEVVLTVTELEPTNSEEFTPSADEQSELETTQHVSDPVSTIDSEEQTLVASEVPTLSETIQSEPISHSVEEQRDQSVIEKSEATVPMGEETIQVETILSPQLEPTETETAETDKVSSETIEPKSMQAVETPYPEEINPGLKEASAFIPDDSTGSEIIPPLVELKPADTLEPETIQSEDVLTLSNARPDEKATLNTEVQSLQEEEKDIISVIKIENQTEIIPAATAEPDVADTSLDVEQRGQSVEDVPIELPEELSLAQSDRPDIASSESIASKLIPAGDVSPSNEKESNTPVLETIQSVDFPIAVDEKIALTVTESGATNEDEQNKQPETVLESGATNENEQSKQSDTISARKIHDSISAPAENTEVETTESPKHERLTQPLRQSATIVEPEFIPPEVISPSVSERADQTGEKTTLVAPADITTAESIQPDDNLAPYIEIIQQPLTESAKTPVPDIKYQHTTLIVPEHTDQAVLETEASTKSETLATPLIEPPWSESEIKPMTVLTSTNQATLETIAEASPINVNESIFTPVVKSEELKEMVPTEHIEESPTLTEEASTTEFTQVDDVVTSVTDKLEESNTESTETMLQEARTPEIGLQAVVQEAGEPGIKTISMQETLAQSKEVLPINELESIQNIAVSSLVVEDKVETEPKPDTPAEPETMVPDPILLVPNESKTSSMNEQESMQSESVSSADVDQKQDPRIIPASEIDQVVLDSTATTKVEPKQPDDVLLTDQIDQQNEKPEKTESVSSESASKTAIELVVDETADQSVISSATITEPETSLPESPLELKSAIAIESESMTPSTDPSPVQEAGEPGIKTISMQETLAQPKEVLPLNELESIQNIAVSSPVVEDKVETDLKSDTTTEPETMIPDPIQLVPSESQTSSMLEAESTQSESVSSADVNQKQDPLILPASQIDQVQVDSTATTKVEPKQPDDVVLTDQIDQQNEKPDTTESVSSESTSKTAIELVVDQAADQSVISSITITEPEASLPESPLELKSAIAIESESMTPRTDPSPVLEQLDTILLETAAAPDTIKPESLMPSPLEQDEELKIVSSAQIAPQTVLDTSETTEVLIVCDDVQSSEEINQPSRITPKIANLDSVPTGDNLSTEVDDGSEKILEPANSSEETTTDTVISASKPNETIAQPQIEAVEVIEKLSEQTEAIDAAKVDEEIKPVSLTEAETIKSEPVSHSAHQQQSEVVCPQPNEEPSIGSTDTTVPVINQINDLQTSEQTNQTVLESFEITNADEKKIPSVNETDQTELDIAHTPESGTIQPAVISSSTNETPTSPVIEAPVTNIAESPEIMAPPSPVIEQEAKKTPIESATVSLQIVKQTPAFAEATVPQSEQLDSDPPPDLEQASPLLTDIAPSSNEQVVQAVPQAALSNSTQSEAFSLSEPSVQAVASTESTSIPNADATTESTPNQLELTPSLVSEPANFHEPPIIQTDINITQSIVSAPLDSESHLEIQPDKETDAPHNIESQAEATPVIESVEQIKVEPKSTVDSEPLPSEPSCNVTNILKEENVEIQNEPKNNDQLSSDSNNTDESVKTTVENFGDERAAKIQKLSQDEFTSSTSINLDPVYITNNHSCPKNAHNNLTMSTTTTNINKSSYVITNGSIAGDHKSTACSEKPLLHANEAEEELEHVDEDDLFVLRRFVPGSIAEREYKKWYNAVDMPNNPYAPDALKRRISGSQEKFIDLPNISPSTEQNPITLMESTSAAATSAIEEREQSQERDYKRYSRDYYINDVKAQQHEASKKPHNTAYSNSQESVDIIINEAEIANKTATTTPNEHIYKALPAQVVEDPASLETQSTLSNQSIQSVNTTTSDESDTIRIYDFNKQETTVVMRESNTAAAAAVQRICTASTQSTSLESNLETPDLLNAGKKKRPTDLAIAGESSGVAVTSPTPCTPSRGSTPTAFKFLQPKRRLIDPSQVMSFDEEDVPPTTPVERKPIEDEVAHVLPSVKALAQAFLMTSHKSSNVMGTRRWPMKIKKATLEAQKNTTTTLQPKLLEASPASIEIGEDATIASDLSSLETDPLSQNEAIESTDPNADPSAAGTSPVPVRSGFLRSNIAFFENLKFK